MENFLMICTVCVDFFGPKGEVFRITPYDRGLITTAPAWIKDTLTFKLLEKDGSVQYVTKANEKQLENDPMKGIAADGKAEEVVEEVVEKKPKAKKENTDPVTIDVDVPKTRRTRKAKDDA